jgi:hypothetical protein
MALAIPLEGAFTSPHRAAVEGVPRMTDAKLIALDAVRDVPHPTDQPEQQPTWQPANLIELAATPPAPPTIGGLLYPGKRTVLSGETES